MFSIFKNVSILAVFPNLERCTFFKSFVQIQTKNICFFEKCLRILKFFCCLKRRFKILKLFTFVKTPKFSKVIKI